MPVREVSQPTPPPQRPPRYSADEVRGGNIILRTRIQRIIFIAGLVGAAVAALLLRILAGPG